MNQANCVVNNTTGPTAAQCAAATAFVQKQMNVEVPRSVSSDMGFAKLDYRPGERNSITFDLNAMHWRFTRWHPNPERPHQRQHAGQ